MRKILDKELEKHYRTADAIISHVLFYRVLIITQLLSAAQL